MLTSIHIKNVASYDETIAESLSDLRKINFVYGANGCGKTTISNYLLDTERENYEHCQVNWEQSTPISTIVYNKEFRDANFGSGKIAGVFTLGQATKEELEEIENKKSEQTELENFIKTKKETVTKQKESLDAEKDSYTKERWDNCYLKYKDDFKDAFRGSIKSKKAFVEKLGAVCVSEYSPETIPSFQEIKEKSKTIFGEEPISISSLQPPIFSNILELESDPIWQTVIVGKSDVDIADLISRLGANDWVEQGRNFLQENNTCPFCQQETISPTFRNQLEEYFDETFMLKKEEVITKSSQYSNTFTHQLTFLKELENQEKNNPDTKLNITIFSAHLKTLESLFAENIEHSKTKINTLSNTVILTSTESEWTSIKECIDEANTKIAEHNRIVREFQNEQEKLKTEIWQFVAEESKSLYLAHKNKLTGINRGITAIEEQIATKNSLLDTLSDEIIELNKNVTSVQPAVDEINRLLTEFGFHNFKLVPSPDVANHYTILREDGSLAHTTLSEGEITFITFLYFLQLVKGSHTEENVTDDRVVVIDDPISSLDSNILFIVSTLIKGLIKDIKDDSGRTKQLILLTHNVYFHKEVSFIDGRTSQNNQTHFWIIRKISKKSKIQSYGMNNPIESSYELLWNEIKNWRSNSGTTVQNTMRRIIENYFKILGKYGDDDLINKFETQEERDICRSLLCWINDGSHCLPDDLFVQSPDDCTERYLTVFKGIFEHTDNLGHYDMMMRN